MNIVNPSQDTIATIFITQCIPVNKSCHYITGKPIPWSSTSVGNFADGGPLFYPAIWPAPFCHEGSTSKQPGQVAQECEKVPCWTAFANILKAVTSLERQQWLRIIFKNINLQSKDFLKKVYGTERYSL